MNPRIALYSLGIGIIALSSAIYSHVVHGTAISTKGLLAAVPRLNETREVLPTLDRSQWAAT